jgi:hypothetical protein
MPVGAAILTLVGMLFGFHLRAAHMAMKRYVARRQTQSCMPPRQPAAA